MHLDIHIDESVAEWALTRTIILEGLFICILVAALIILAVVLIKQSRPAKQRMQHQDQAHPWS